MHQDAVLWKSVRIWNTATDADLQANAVDELTNMLLLIGNETKRNAYYKAVPDMIVAMVAINKDAIKNKIREVEDVSKKLDRLKNRPLTFDNSAEMDLLVESKLLLDGNLAELKALPTAFLKESELKKSCAVALQKRKADIEQKKMQANFEKNNQNVGDAGLPDDFKGSQQDIWDALKYGIYVHDNVYYSRGGGRGDYPVSNFTMKIVYHVETSDEVAFRLISIKNTWGMECMININTDDFVSVGSFKKVLARRGDYVFKGTDSDLCRLQEYLQKDETSAKRIETLGWNKQGNYWAWSNGLSVLTENGIEFVPIDDYGIVENKTKKFFIPAMSMMFRDKESLFANEKKFYHTEELEEFGFKEWSTLMYGAYQKKAIPAILFFIGSLFRDVIMDRLHRYPLLNLFGPPGAGKGEMYDSIQQMFGQKQDQIMLGGATTIVGFMRKTAQFKNGIVGMDEYKNTLLSKVIESLKNLYDGIGYERGKMTQDFATESTPVNSSTILMGQDMPTVEPALFMRCIMLCFEEGKFSDAQRKAFTELKTQEHHGLSYITAKLLIFRKRFAENFKDQYNLIFKQTIKDVANVEVDDRMIMNISILLTTMNLVKDVVDFPFKYDEAKAYLIDNMLQQHLVLAGNNDVAKFWGVVESLFHQGIIFEGKDFMLQDGYMYLCLTKVQPFYQKECIARRDVNYLSKPTLEHYLKLDKSVFIGFNKKRFADGGNNYAYQFKYDKLDIDMIKITKGDLSPAAVTEALRLKHVEMGIPFDNEAVIADEDLPFPPYIPN